MTRAPVRVEDDGRSVVLEKAGDNPYTRVMTAGPTVAYVADDLVAWVGRGPWGPVAGAVGDVTAAAGLFAALRAAGDLGDIRRLHLPRTPLEPLAGNLTVSAHEHWDFRWLVGPLAPHPDEHLAEPLGPTDLPAVEELLDAALPQTPTRPGGRRVRGWWGIRARGRLVACGADRSVGALGYLAAIAVHPARWGRGLGTALTTAMTRSLLAEYGEVALGVEVGNARAIALYARLGFTGTVTRTTVWIV